VVENLDNGSQKYYKGKWHGKNPFISSILPLVKGRGTKVRDLAWIMLIKEI
jgi:hypothetical protein